MNISNFVLFNFLEKSSEKNGYGSTDYLPHFMYESNKSISEKSLSQEYNSVLDEKIPIPEVADVSIPFMHPIEVIIELRLYEKRLSAKRPLLLKLSLILILKAINKYDTELGNLVTNVADRWCCMLKCIESLYRSGELTYQSYFARKQSLQSHYNRF